MTPITVFVDGTKINVYLAGHRYGSRFYIGTVDMEPSSSEEEFSESFWARAEEVVREVYSDEESEEYYELLEVASDWYGEEIDEVAFDDDVQFYV